MNKLKYYYLIIFLFSLVLLSTKSVSAQSQTFYQTTVTWNVVPGITQYNIYYKEKGATKYMHAVGSLPNTMTSYTIKYLKPGVSYIYNIAGLDMSKKEIWWSGEKRFYNMQVMKQ